MISSYVKDFRGTTSDVSLEHAVLTIFSTQREREKGTNVISFSYVRYAIIPTTGKGKEHDEGVKCLPSHQTPSLHYSPSPS